jgi:uncharacterized protein (TIRG00374 family)
MIGKRLKSAALFTVKGLIATGLVIWLVKSGKLDFRTLAEVRLGWSLLLVFGAQTLMLALPLMRWFVLVRAQTLELTLGRALQVGMIGYFASLFLPSSIGADGLRVMYLCRQNKGREHAVVSTVIADRLLGTLGLIVIGAVFGALLYGRLGNIVLGRIVLFLVGMLGMCLVALALLSWSRVRVLTRPFCRWKMVGNLMDALAEYRHRRAVMGWALVLSLAGHLSSLTAAYLAFQTLGNPASPQCVFAIMPLVNLSGIVPLTPMGLGVADSAAVALFSLVGVSGGAEVTMLLRAATVTLSAFGSVAYLLPTSSSTAIRNLVDKTATGVKQNISIHEDH